MSTTNENFIKKKTFSLNEFLRALGKFGRYQTFIFLSICVLVLLSGSYAVNFIFTASNIKYRCLVPECEINNFGKYNSGWIKEAIPFEDGQPVPCARFKFLNKTNSCHFENFDREHIEKCDQIVFDEYEKTIAKEVSVICKLIYYYLLYKENLSI